MLSIKRNYANVCVAILYLAALSLLANICCSSAQPVDRREVSDYSEKAKRPFCNAFTGCGMKRSDSGSKVSELDDLARFIIAEKTWEQLQKEANMMRSSSPRDYRLYQQLPSSLAYRRRRSSPHDHFRSQTQPNFGDLDLKTKRSELDYKEILDQEE